MFVNSGPYSFFLEVCVVVRTCRLAVAILSFVSMFTLWSSAAATKPSSLKKTSDVTITLTPSVDSPQYLGTSIDWTASVQGPKGHIYDYQFSVSLQGQNQVVKDFRPQNSFTWVPYTVEGTYQVIVTVRDITSQPYIVFAPVSVSYVIMPWVTAPAPVSVPPPCVSIASNTSTS